MKLQHQVINRLWLTVVDNVPSDRFAELWAHHCWRTTTPIRLVDDDGLVVREFHPKRRTK